MIKLQGEKQVNRGCMLSELPICKDNNIEKENMKKELDDIHPFGTLPPLEDLEDDFDSPDSISKIQLDNKDSHVKYF